MDSSETRSAKWSDSDFIVFIDSITRSDWNASLKFIQLYPEIVNAEGRDANGNLVTALHKAVLCAPYAICKLLIEQGAKADARTSGGDYPFLYACRRGNLPLTYLLLYHGAQVNVRDTQERAAVHFLCMSGQVASLAFFDSEDALFRIELEAVDARGRNALHYTAEMGHVELFQFLRRRGRLFATMACAQDSNGDTPLHIAAARGHTVLVHDGLQTLGRMALQGAEGFSVKTVLAARNAAGQTCLEVVQQLVAACSAPVAPSPYPRAGDPPGGRSPATLAKYRGLEEYLQRGAANRSEAAVARFFAEASSNAQRNALYMPFIRSTGIFFLWLLAAYSQSLVLKTVVTLCNALLLFLLGRDVLWSDHRLAHVSRAPNPLFASFYGAGVVHTLLSFCLWTVSAAFGTADGISLPALAFLLLCTVLFLAAYGRLLTVDPGYVSVGASNQRTGKRHTLLDCAVDGLSVDRYCSTCEMFVDEQDVRHCRLCQRCIRSQDHHCVFLTRCVARRHVPLFIFWLILDCILQFTFIYSAFVFVASAYSQTVKDDHFWTMLEWFADVHWFLVLIVMSVVTSFWAASLVMYQVKDQWQNRADSSAHSAHGRHSHSHSQGLLSRCATGGTRHCRNEHY